MSTSWSIQQPTWQQGALVALQVRDVAVTMVNAVVCLTAAEGYHLCHCKAPGATRIALT